MHTDWLHNFATAVKCRSLSRAAAELNLTQPALSKQMRNLEEKLGVKLFKRTNQGVELTEAGELFYQKIGPVLNDLLQIQSDLQPFRDNSPIRLGSLPSLASYYLPLKVKGFRLGSRRVVLSIEHTSPKLVSSLFAGHLDAVLIDSSCAHPPLWSRDLFSEPYYAVLPSDHPLRDRSALTVADILAEPLIVQPPECDLRKSVLEQIARPEHQPNITAEVAFGEAILGSVAAGSGIAVLPEMIAKHIGHLPLIALPIADLSLQRTICIASRSAETGQRLYKLLAG